MGTSCQTFLIRCAETNIFSGFDMSFRKYRIVALRINHLNRKDVIETVEKYERDHRKEGYGWDNYLIGI